MKIDIEAVKANLETIRQTKATLLERVAALENDEQKLLAFIAMAEDYALNESIPQPGSDVPPADLLAVELSPEPGEPKAIEPSADEWTSERLRAERLRLGITLVDLAIRIHELHPETRLYDRSSLGKIENGAENSPNVRSLMREALVSIGGKTPLSQDIEPEPKGVLRRVVTQAIIGAYQGGDILTAKGIIDQIGSRIFEGRAIKGTPAHQISPLLSLECRDPEGIFSRVGEGQYRLKLNATTIIAKRYEG
jgi:transcriptional regulator with XRE-family HTH domain